MEFAELVARPGPVRGAGESPTPIRPVSGAAAAPACAASCAGAPSRTRVEVERIEVHVPGVVRAEIGGGGGGPGVVRLTTLDATLATSALVGDLRAIGWDARVAASPPAKPKRDAERNPNNDGRGDDARR